MALFVTYYCGVLIGVLFALLFGFLYSQRVAADAVKTYQAQMHEEGTTSPLIEPTVEEAGVSGEKNENC